MNNFILYMMIKIFVGWFHKILIKIFEVINIKENTTNILSEIKILRNLNSHDNIHNNNSKNNTNNNENNDAKNNEGFKITDIQDGINFLNILGEKHAELIFYKLIKLLIKIKYSEEEKIFY